MQACVASIMLQQMRSVLASDQIFVLDFEIVIHGVFCLWGNVFINIIPPHIITAILRLLITNAIAPPTAVLTSWSLESSWTRSRKEREKELETSIIAIWSESLVISSQKGDYSSDLFHVLRVPQT